MNCQDDLRKLNCCHSETYRKQQVFCFLPGHQVFILNIMKLVKEFEEHKQGKNKRASKYSLAQQQLVQQADERIEINENVIAINKNKLLNRLIKFAEKFFIKFLNESECELQLEDVFTLDVISNFNAFTNEYYKCQLKCPMCEKYIAALYKSNWFISNYEGHLKTHVSDPIEYAECQITTQPNENKSSIKEESVDKQTQQQDPSQAQTVQNSAHLAAKVDEPTQKPQDTSRPQPKPTQDITLSITDPAAVVNEQTNQKNSISGEAQPKHTITNSTIIMSDHEKSDQQKIKSKWLVNSVTENKDDTAAFEPETSIIESLKNKHQAELSLEFEEDE